MENFMKNHTPLRIGMIVTFFVLGLAMVIGGWFLSGKATGLFIQLGGTVLLLAALFVYNAAYKDPKHKRTSR
ncbi:MAG: hypothetical protein PT944_03255 [Actinomycetaceae bacterium]|nr:hypothetical protein [Arcanobacterium sp.]MDD7686919.1 hypothetical protein [Actinomycetaceae bacterium]MDY5273745.1 hypothetical protein [Arcanobacterium sp.]